MSGMTVTAITNTVAMFTTLLPSPSELRRVSTAEEAEDAHTMQLIAVGLSLGVGAGLTIIEKDAAPFLVSVLLAGALVAGSEILIREIREDNAHDEQDD